MQFRQGDVFIEQVDGLPPGAERLHGPIILAEGEATGHAHRVSNRLAKFFQAANGERFLVVKRRTAVEHEEHDPVALSPGTYQVKRQREYSPEEIRNVAD